MKELFGVYIFGFLIGILTMYLLKSIENEKLQAENEALKLKIELYELKNK